MKKSLLLVLFCVLTVSAPAQEVVRSFLEKFGKDENLEIVSISKKMLQKMKTTTASDDAEFMDAIKNLDQINMVTSVDKKGSEEYYEIARGLMEDKKKEGFEELIASNDHNEDLLVIVKESKGLIHELVLLSKNETGEFSLISLNGRIDVKSLIKYAEKMNISGLDKLRTLDNK